MFNRNKDDKPDQSKEQMDALVEAFSAKLETKLEEKLSPLRTTVEGIKTEWDGIKAEANKPPEVDHNKNADGTELTDEQRRDRDSRTQFALIVATNARITEQNLISEVRAQWPHLVPRIQEILGSFTLAEKAQANYPIRCQNAVKLIVGEEAMKAGLKYDGTAKRFMIEDSTGGGEVDGDNSLSEYDWTDPRNPNKHLTGVDQLIKLGLTRKDFEDMQKNGII